LKPEILKLSLIYFKKAIPILHLFFPLVGPSDLFI
jgi:hypothetical protein